MRYPDLALTNDPRENQTLYEYRIVEMNKDHTLMRLLLLFLKTRFPKTSVYWSRSTMLVTTPNTNWTHTAIQYFRSLYLLYSTFDLPNDVQKHMFLIAIAEWAYSAQKWAVYSNYPLTYRFTTFKGEYTPLKDMEHIATDPAILALKKSLEQHASISVVRRPNGSVCVVNLHPD